MDKQTDLTLHPAFKPDDEIEVRHDGGQRMLATLWLVHGDEAHLRFPLSGIRRLSLKTGRFVEKGRKMAGMRSWHVGGAALERLRETAKRQSAEFKARLQDGRLRNANDS